MAKAVTTSLPYVKGRGRDFCRGCHGVNLFTGIDLGNVPLANEFLQDNEIDFNTYPLELRVCSDCGLGQVADVTTPNVIFRNYRYLSSISSTFLDHAELFVKDVLEKKLVTTQDWVLEIASNDGYLLKNFMKHGIEVIGIEPARNIAIISNHLGINTISEFFSSELARNIQSKYGYPKLIIANNVMAHVPDLDDFILGLSILTGQNTLISVENPSIMNVLAGKQFDTIYHEHYSYLSGTSLSKLTDFHGLELYEIESLSTHGGSNRYWIRKKGDQISQSSTVSKLCSEEVKNGLLDIIAWQICSASVLKMVVSFHDWLAFSYNQGKKVYGYGAAAKASTLINVARIESEWIIGIADASEEKQGRYMPSCLTPIISPTELKFSNVTDVIIFAWNIKTEILEVLKNLLKDEVKIWCFFPDTHEVKR
jgi:hypothetical protein